MFAGTLWWVPAIASDFNWRLPPGFPPPLVPKDNPISAAKVELGRHLFFDVRLSVNENLACATCHQRPAFADSRRQSVGSLGDPLPRHAPTLVNLAYRSSYGWSDEGTHSLEAQMQRPLFGEHPVEMGLTGNERSILARLSEDGGYRKLFASAFGDERVSTKRIVAAIASFERTLISGTSPFDQWLFYDRPPGESVVNGFAVFQRVSCDDCHHGINFNGDFVFKVGQERPNVFFNTGIEPGQRFRTPSLRNVAVTAPYMHDGSFATLVDVIDHYATGPNQGEGLTAFTLSDEERANLIRFLEALTDAAFLADERLNDPFATPRE